MSAATVAHEKLLTGARRRLEKTAIEYARMKAFGCYLKTDGYHQVSHSERNNHEDMLLRAVGLAAEQLLIEMTGFSLPEAQP